MSHIQNIEIKNFKSIRHQTIEGCRRINVFIGYPNVGKSNILEAIGLLTFVRQKRPIGLKGLIRFERFTQIFNYLKINEPAIVTFNHSYSLSITYSNEKEVLLRLLESDKNFDFANHLNFLSLSVGRENLLSSSTNEIDDFSGRFYELRHFNVKPYKFSSKTFDKIFSALELKVPEGENMFEVIANNSDMTKEFSELLKPYHISLVIDQATSDIRVNLKKEGEVLYTLPTSMIADTLLRLIFFKTAIYSNKDSILLFEEPEAHMFPPYISKLTSDIVNDENHNQFFLATHSPFVLNDLISNTEKDELSIYLVTYENETGETLIHRMNEEDVNEAYQFGYDFFMNINNFIPQKEHGQI